MNHPPPRKKNSALFPTAAVLMNIPSQACLLYLYTGTDNIIPQRTVRRIKRVHVSQRFLEHLPNTCFNKTEPNRGHPARTATTLRSLCSGFPRSIWRGVLLSLQGGCGCGGATPSPFSKWVGARWLLPLICEGRRVSG